MNIMIKKFDIFLLIKVLLILITLSLIVIIRAEYHQMGAHDRVDEFLSYFTPLTFHYMAIRLLSFGTIFVTCYDLKAAITKRLHVNKKRLIFSIILLLGSLIDYFKLMYSDVFIGWIGISELFYLQSTDYLTLVISALAGFLCCSSFKNE